MRIRLYALFFLLTCFSALTSRAATSSSQALARVQALEGRDPLISGPNCWNSVLYIQDLVENLRYSSPEELQFWLGSAFCEKIEASKDLQTTDVVAIRSQVDGELHAMTWLNENLVFSKNTSHKRDLYETQNTDLILSMFRVNDSSCQNPNSKNQLRCTRWADFYRCRSATEERRLALKKDLELNDLYEQTQFIASQIEKGIFQKNPNLKTQPELLIELAAIQNKVSQHRNKNTFFWRALVLQLDSLETQVLLLGSPRYPVQTHF